MAFANQPRYECYLLCYLGTVLKIRSDLGNNDDHLVVCIHNQELFSTKTFKIRLEHTLYTKGTNII